MMPPRSKFGCDIFDALEAAPAPRCFESLAGVAWTWPAVEISVERLKSLCSGGIECIENGVRFDAEFFMWCCPLQRVGVVFFDGDVTLFESDSVTALTNWAHHIRNAPTALQRVADREKINRRHREEGFENPFS